MERTTLGTAALAHDLRLSVMRLSRRLRGQRADTSLTLTQLAALSTLRAKGPLTPGELAAYERVQPPSMTRVLATLEGAGLVTRSKHLTDRRQVIVQVTDEANRLLDDEIRMREAWLAQRINELRPDEREQLRRASAIIDRLLE
ncbi:MAG: MarR family transcriptional regulator [Actinomycetota bacterium]|nr:MarR family transcriptional regulator [Actinomycetota bacterium]